MDGGIYIAYPIDQYGPGSSALFTQIDKFKDTAIRGGVAKWVFDPGDAFIVDPNAAPDDSLPRINRAAAVNASAVVAFLPSATLTIGVPIEIDRAVSQGKHVVIFSPCVNSWMLQYPPRNPRIARYDDWDDESITDALGWLFKQETRDWEQPQYQDLFVKVDGEGGQMPKRAYDDDAGLDLYTAEPVTIPAGEFRDVPCGISVELPPSTWGLVTGRSSALRKKGLLIHSGIIDAGYRGPLFAGAFNLTDRDVRIEQGERISQLIVLANGTRRVTPIRVDQLGPSARGERGFGSSGT